MPSKSLWRKQRLASILSRVAPHPSPTPRLEQYTIDADTAATILWLAAWTYGDIAGKVVFDLGCGTGRLGIGASLLGASKVVGIDIDAQAIGTAVENGRKAGADVCWIIGDISCLRGRCDVVIQNPPFGVQRRRADRPFLSKALEMARVTYSLHKGGSREFIKAFALRHGGQVTDVLSLRTPIPPMFPFHTKRRHIVDVDLFRIVCRP
ncbi:TPA: methyltransferase domain-containing protein [Candidatus Bathyarchaeota archaeon]|nr:methyltransferase domain-containing protein [Candidatus Bathyarchaeota archaeon]